MSTRIGTIGGGKDPGEFKGAAIDDIVFNGVGFKTGVDKGFIGVGVKTGVENPVPSKPNDELADTGGADEGGFAKGLQSSNNSIRSSAAEGDAEGTEAFEAGTLENAPQSSVLSVESSKSEDAQASTGLVRFVAPSCIPFGLPRFEENAGEDKVDGVGERVVREGPAIEEDVDDEPFIGGGADAGLSALRGAILLCKSPGASW